MAKSVPPSPSVLQAPQAPQNPRGPDAVSTPPGAPRRFVLTVWHSREGRFLARAELPNGTRLEFDSPFDLVRFLDDSTASAPRPPGLR